MENKYIITCWASCFDYDGMYNDFKILAVCKTREESFKKLDILADKIVKDEIKKQKKDKKEYVEFEIPSYKKRCGSAEKFYSLPNNKNRVIVSALRGIVDTSLPDYNKNYYSLAIIEVSKNREITPELFITKDNETEVMSWFKKIDFLTKN